MVKVSVIVAAYNVEKYIWECVCSIRKQTLRDIEIIVVNDGSTDGTRGILEKLSRLDNRIKIINKNNGGILAARGTGYKASRGKYILFIDGDDWIEETCCEEMYCALESTNADIAMCDFSERYVHNFLIGRSGDFNQIGKEEYIKGFLIGNISCYIWTRMIHRELMEGIDFEKKISLGEDTYINIELMNKINNVVRIDKPLINYRIRCGSLTKKYDDSIYDIWKIIKCAKEKDFIALNHEFSEEFDMFIYNNVIIGRILDKVNFNKKIHKKMYDMYKEMNVDILNNKYFKNNVSIKHKILTYMFFINYTLGKFTNSVIRLLQKIIGNRRRLELYP